VGGRDRELDLDVAGGRLRVRVVDAERGPRPVRRGQPQGPLGDPRPAGLGRPAHPRHDPPQPPPATSRSSSRSRPPTSPSPSPAKWLPPHRRATPRPQAAHDDRPRHRDAYACRELTGHPCLAPAGRGSRDRPAPLFPPRRRVRAGTAPRRSVTPRPAAAGRKVGMRSQRRRAAGPASPAIAPPSHRAPLPPRVPLPHPRCGRTAPPTSIAPRPTRRRKRGHPQASEARQQGPRQPRIGTPFPPPRPAAPHRRRRRRVRRAAGEGGRIQQTRQSAVPGGEGAFMVARTGPNRQAREGGQAADWAVSVRRTGRGRGGWFGGARGTWISMSASRGGAGVRLSGRRQCVRSPRGDDVARRPFGLFGVDERRWRRSQGRGRTRGSSTSAWCRSDRAPDEAGLPHGELDIVRAHSQVNRRGPAEIRRRSHGPGRRRP